MSFKPTMERKRGFSNLSNTLLQKSLHELINKSSRKMGNKICKNNNKVNFDLCLLRKFSPENIYILKEEFTFSIQ